MDWPLFEYDEEAGRYVSAHHPFTQPKAEDVARLATDPPLCMLKLTMLS